MESIEKAQPVEFTTDLNDPQIRKGGLIGWGETEMHRVTESGHTEQIVFGLIQEPSHKGRIRKVEKELITFLDN